MSSSRTDAQVDVTMPQMGVSVAEGTVVEWRKQAGDWVERDEVIAAISTDKIDTDVESPATGRVEEILVAVGETVEVGAVLARIASDAEPGPRARDGGRRRARRPGRRGRAAGRHRRRSRCVGAGGCRHGGRAAGATRRSWRAWRRSTTSTSSGSRAPGAAGGCASRTCWRIWSARTAPPSRRCTSSRPTSPTGPRRRASASRGCARRSPPPGRRPAASPPPRCRACAPRSAAPWSSRCARRRPARRSSRRT